jgi:cbb3-type cytochrome oxidase subunit 3
MTTLQVTGDDVMLAVHVARIVGSIVMTLLIILVIAWAVRTPRRVRDRDDAIEHDAADDAALRRAVDRMEARLEVLERALADQIEQPRGRGRRQDQDFAPADEGRDSGRME